MADKPKSKVELRPTLETFGIKALSHEEIIDLCKELGMPGFKAKQLEQWLYAKGATSYDEMTNLSKADRAKLDEVAPLYTPEIVKKQVSEDGTRKYLLRLHDGTTVETVGLPSKDRLTVCFSTQAGCAMRCVFCATGKGGFVRNLAPGEMVDQIMIVAKDFGERVTNAVAMGQGEPFNNYDSVLAALRFLNSPNCLNIGARHITVSTCGILPQIRKFAAEPEQFTFAVSLHSAIQETRNSIMPGVRFYDIEKLQSSLRSYSDNTGRRVTLEYALIDGVNDTDEELKALILFCRKLFCHVNLIPMNNVNDSRFNAPLPKRVSIFSEKLAHAGIECTVRTPRGVDIDGACGQLKQKTK